MKLFEVKKKRRSNWSVRFAWFPVKVEYNYKYYPLKDYKYYPQLKDQTTFETTNTGVKVVSTATAKDDCSPYTCSPYIPKTEYWWIWLERYKRFFNYGAPVNYYISKNHSNELYGIERIK